MGAGMLRREESFQFHKPDAAGATPLDPTAELGRKAAIRPLSANRLAPEDACPEPPGPPTGRHAHDADHIPNGDTADGPGAPERWNDVDGVLDFTDHSGRAIDSDDEWMPGARNGRDEARSARAEKASPSVGPAIGDARHPRGPVPGAAHRTPQSQRSAYSARQHRHTPGPPSSTRASLPSTTGRDPVPPATQRVHPLLVLMRGGMSGLAARTAVRVPLDACWSTLPRETVHASIATVASSRSRASSPTLSERRARRTPHDAHVATGQSGAAWDLASTRPESTARTVASRHTRRQSPRRPNTAGDMPSQLPWRSRHHELGSRPPVTHTPRAWDAWVPGASTFGAAPWRGAAATHVRPLSPPPRKGGNRRAASASATAHVATPGSTRPSASARGSEHTPSVALPSAGGLSPWAGESTGTRAGATHRSGGAGSTSRAPAAAAVGRKGPRRGGAASSPPPARKWQVKGPPAVFKTKPPAPNSSDGAAKPVGQDSGGAKPAESGGEAVAAQQGAADDAHTLEDECRSIEEKVAVLDSLTSALEELGRHQAEMQAIQELASGLMAVQEGDTAQGAARSPSPTGVLSSKHPDVLREVLRAGLLHMSAQLQERMVALERSLPGTPPGASRANSARQAATVPVSPTPPLLPPPARRRASEVNSARHGANSLPEGGGVAPVTAPEGKPRRPMSAVAARRRARQSVGWGASSDRALDARVTLEASPLLSAAPLSLAPISPAPMTV